METDVGTGFIILYYLIIVGSIILLIAMLKYSIKKHQFQAVGKTIWVNVVFTVATMIVLETIIILLVKGVP